MTFEREGAGDEGGRKEGREKGKERMDTAEGKTLGLQRLCFSILSCTLLSIDSDIDTRGVSL